jgi:aquaporin Z
MDMRKLLAEALGTFWLVLGGCGTAVIASNVVGTLGVAFAFGLTVLTGAAALGHISGGHFNPAVTAGLVAGRRFPSNDALPYIVSQVVGAIVAASVIFVIADGRPDFEKGTFAANGFDEFSPQGYNLLSAMVVELVLTALFIVVIMGATRRAASTAAAPVAIGLALTLIHLISIPVTNTSVNPARSTGQALFAGSDLIAQLWLFWLAPLVGGVLGGLLYRSVFGLDDDDLEEVGDLMPAVDGTDRPVDGTDRPSDPPE